VCEEACLPQEVCEEACLPQEVFEEACLPQELMTRQGPFHALDLSVPQDLQVISQEMFLTH
jgi:hypothetical protein